jgi:hypothetical protein
VPPRHQLWAISATNREATTLRTRAYPNNSSEAATLQTLAATTTFGVRDQTPFSLPPNDLFTCGQPRQRCPSGATAG